MLVGLRRCKHCGSINASWIDDRRAAASESSWHWWRMHIFHLQFGSVLHDQMLPMGKTSHYKIQKLIYAALLS